MTIQNPLVSISCVTFNHAKFIRQCLDGFLMQKTDFNFEILIHDDASTDGTKEIIEEYVAKYPDLIFPLIQKENQYSKGQRGFMAKFNFPRAKGKYIALCEGDDYWTDPLKLQKQVDFLEDNPNFNIVFHEAQILEKDSLIKNELTPNKANPISFNDILSTNFMHTNTICMRNNILDFPDWYYSAMPGDHPLQLFSLFPDKLAFKLNDVMSVYRIHGNGIWSQDKGRKFLLEKALTKIDIYKHFNLSNDAFLKKIFYMLADYISVNGYKKISLIDYSNLLYRFFPKKRFFQKRYFYIYHPWLSSLVQKIFLKNRKLN